MRTLTITSLLVALSVAGCSKGGGSSPTAPTQTAPSISAGLSLVLTTVTASTAAGGGYTYTIGLRVREGNGVAATISSADFTFSASGAPFGSSHVDSPFSNKISANATADSKSLTMTDSNVSHPLATLVTTVLNFTDDNGHSGTFSGSQDVARIPDPPVIVSFTVDATNVNPGTTTTLRWTTTNATSASISGIGSVATSGSQAITPTNYLSTYTLTATNADGSTTKSVSVLVNYAAVQYVVSGTPRANIITYATASGGTGQVAPANLPWTYEMSSVTTGTFLYVSAQNDLASGCISVYIYKRGALYKTTQSCGAYVIATASGSY